MTHLPADIQALYAELLERLMAGRVDGLAGEAQGSFTRKVVQGTGHLYFQHADPAGAKRQTYLGPGDPVLDAAVEKLREAWASGEEGRGVTRRLCAQLQAGGVTGIDPPSARLIRGLADAGIFHLGGMLLGTHAFIAIGTMLGVRWSPAGLPTKEKESGTLRITVVAPDLPGDPPPALSSLKAGFLPFPPLSQTSPSTAFSIKGREMRVDLLTPARPDFGGQMVLIRRLSAMAQPLLYLDYLLEGGLPAAIPDGEGILVTIPDPGRLALHKMLIASDRPAIFHATREREMRQSAELIRFLLAERPDDLERAVEGVKDRGRRWLGLARKGLAELVRFEPGIGKRFSL
jgi:hypothetical protein